MTKLFGSDREYDNNLGLKTNTEIKNLNNNQRTINYIVSLRIGWLGLIIWMDNQRLPKNKVIQMETSKK